MGDNKDFLKILDIEPSNEIRFYSTGFGVECPSEALYIEEDTGNVGIGIRSTSSSAVVFEEAVETIPLLASNPTFYCEFCLAHRVPTEQGNCPGCGCPLYK